MDFDLACAITQAPADLARAERRRLERELDAWSEAHRLESEARFALARGECDADAAALADLARAIAAAGRQVSGALADLARAGLSTPTSQAAPDAAEIGARFEEALDGALLPSAARVVGAALALELA